MANAELKYKAEIDGLRALAVLAVVLFHVFPGFIPGGFVGVDIFFVISGFLITSHIFERLESNSFDFVEFFSRRIRRLFPALAIVMATALVAGWLFLVADEYAHLSKHLASGVFFILNFILENESGYFDHAAESKPMLHLWSLSVEEQFYIVWPFLLYLVFKNKINTIGLIIVCIFASFFLNIFFIDSDPTKVFFWPFGRFWELMSGSLIAWLLVYRSTNLFAFLLRVDRYCRKFFSKGNLPEDGFFTFNILSVAGILLVSFSILDFNHELSFPGVWAIVPVIGAMLIIIAGDRSRLNQIIFMNPVAVWFGVISYPLYLWHWPILSFLKIINGKLSFIVEISAVLVSIILAWLTYRFIEKPIRQNRLSAKTTLLLLGSMALIAIMGIAIYQSEGARFRAVNKLSVIAPRNISLGTMSPMKNSCALNNLDIEVDVCLTDERKPIRYALVGDSKAKSLSAGLVRTSTNVGRWLVIAGNNEFGSPAPFLSDSPRFSRFQNQLTAAINGINSQPDVEFVALVGAARILAGNYKDGVSWKTGLKADEKVFLEGENALKNTVGEFIKGGKKVLLVVDNPPLGKRESCGTRLTRLPIFGLLTLNLGNKNCSLELDQYYTLRSRYFLALTNIADHFGNDVQVFDTADIFCDTTKQACLREKNGYLSLAYSDHISDYMAGLIGAGINGHLANWKKDLLKK